MAKERDASADSHITRMLLNFAADVGGPEMYQVEFLYAALNRDIQNYREVYNITPDDLKTVFNTLPEETKWAIARRVAEYACLGKVDKKLKSDDLLLGFITEFITSDPLNKHNNDSVATFIGCLYVELRRYGIEEEEAKRQISEFLSSCKVQGDLYEELVTKRRWQETLEQIAQHTSKLDGLVDEFYSKEVLLINMAKEKKMPLVSIDCYDKYFPQDKILTIFIMREGFTVEMNVKVNDGTVDIFPELEEFTKSELPAITTGIVGQFLNKLGGKKGIRVIKEDEKGHFSVIVPLPEGKVHTVKITPNDKSADELATKMMQAVAAQAKPATMAVKSASDYDKHDSEPVQVHPGGGGSQNNPRPLDKVITELELKKGIQRPHRDGTSVSAVPSGTEVGPGTHQPDTHTATPVSAQPSPPVTPPPLAPASAPAPAQGLPSVGGFGNTPASSRKPSEPPMPPTTPESRGEQQTLVQEDKSKAHMEQGHLNDEQELRIVEIIRNMGIPALQKAHVRANPYGFLVTLQKEGKDDGLYKTTIQLTAEDVAKDDTELCKNIIDKLNKKGFISSPSASRAR